VTDLTGLTKSTCAKACSPDRCAITHSICGHPCFQGLQEALRSDPDVSARYAAACKALSVREVMEQ
jgi:hypothetical protein